MGAQMGRGGEPFAAVLERRLSRRGVLGSALGLTAGFLLGGASRSAAAPRPAPLAFKPIPPGTGERIDVPDGYVSQLLLRWGDPVLPGAPAFIPERQTGASQALQFGYNCDFVGFLPLPYGRVRSDHGLLVVNHEYTNPEIMFPNYNPKAPTREQVDVMMAAHGLSVVEIQLREREWQTVLSNRYNRRITANTPCEITGPARGHALMKTPDDPAGTRVLGTIMNCSGGKTPWGTVLSGEENFHQYFANVDALADSDPRKRDYLRYGIARAESEKRWELHEPRFDIARHPNEPNRFGWVLEVDPYDPRYTPRKRTAMGRIKHEAATFAITRDGRVSIYSGDDERFEYVFKFISRDRFNPADRGANRDLLDEGTLFVARFNDDGSGDWLPLVHGQGPLTAANGFADQGEVVINARRAADLLGATKMDRPEDIETNPVNGKVYMVMTNNDLRGMAGRGGPDRPNPRSGNLHGHIIEVTEDGDDYGATRFKWDMFLLCGDPEDPSTYFAGFPKEQVSAISCPDNIAFDRAGNLWIATDGAEKALKRNDGLFAVPVSGEDRGHLRQFMSTVTGSEVCGPEFTPDNSTLFLAIQHPGEGGTYEKPISRWPDDVTPPRPTVIAIRKQSGGAVGE